MTIFFWNPISLTYLTQLVLVLVIAALLVKTQLRRDSHAETPRSTILLASSFGFYGSYSVLSFLRAILRTDLQAWVEPPISVLSSIAIVLFVQFAHHFPEPFARERVERRVVTALSIVFVAVEVGFAIYRYQELGLGHVEYRPAFMDLPAIAAMGWLFVLAFRRALRAATDRDRGRPPDAPKREWSNNPAAAARAVLLFAIVPLLLVIVTLLQAYHLIGVETREIAAALLNLAGLLGFLLLYLNYFVTEGSFSIKLSSTALALVLGGFTSVAWIIGFDFSGAYKGDTSSLRYQTHVFRPTAEGGYNVSRVDYAFVPVEAQVRQPGAFRIELPFDFPFFSKVHRQAFIREDGMVGFESVPTWPDTVFRNGAQPAIFPLAVDLAEPATNVSAEEGIHLSTSPEEVVVTWSGLPRAGEKGDHYAFQMILRPSGEIQFSYQELPRILLNDLFVPNRVPMLMGVTPGFSNGETRLVHFQRGQTLNGPPGTGLIENFRLDYLAYLNGIYTPLAWLILVTSPATLLVFQALFRTNLVRPLDTLLAGVGRFREGTLSQRLPVHFPDEIGYLTRSFNEMAEKQNDLLNGLEDRVTERTAEVTILADRNARLEERSRISSDLHDAVSQTLFSAVLIAETLPEQWKRDRTKAEALLTDIARLNRSALDEMRDLLSRVRSPDLVEPVLGTLLRGLVARFEERHALGISLTVGSDARLDEDVQIAFFRIAQEGLNNVMKHASSATVRLFYEALEGQAILTIEDDGNGFDTAHLREGSMGLQIMAERARKIGAVLETTSRPGHGTQITLIWNQNDA
ncbi:sensor histidine kinase [Rhodopseudomonas palustris]|uniref:HAMP domain-containing sensor histidine kinase n=1 Tax=Rhodopseudomonas palustris TaxID=1076 RepID=UPI002ACD7630|nr:sensor histidine kinase [Rhodopseudomonas palustris]WQG97815.1 sensor histidine kinase [Rhodopseudomonas palustris]